MSEKWIYNGKEVDLDLETPKKIHYPAPSRVSDFFKSIGLPRALWDEIYNNPWRIGGMLTPADNARMAKAYHFARCEYRKNR